MEISQLFPVASTLSIVWPDGSPTGITLQVVGQDSKAFRDVAKRYAQRYIGTDAAPNVDELERQGIELAVACIVGWSGLTEHGEPVPFTKEKANELLSQPEMSFVREQVEQHVSKRANFFRSGAPAA